MLRVCACVRQQQRTDNVRDDNDIWKAWISSATYAKPKMKAAEGTNPAMIDGKPTDMELTALL